MSNQTISEAVRERDAARQKVKDWCRDDLIAECLSLYDRCDCLNGIIRKTSEEMGELRKSFDAAARELWFNDPNDLGLVKCGDDVIGIAVDARNAERFIVSHNLTI